jgi:hypothetical protein
MIKVSYNFPHDTPIIEYYSDDTTRDFLIERANYHGARSYTPEDCYDNDDPDVDESARWLRGWLLVGGGE